jgi:purine-binding chemotaxis protein CheW
MSSNQATQASRELMLFRCDGREFCLDIMQVRDIRGWTPATPLPHAPDYMHGVINLRGQVLPIIDMSTRLGCARTNPTDKHVIIVAQTGDRIAGLLVEAVSDVMTVTSDQIQPTPDLASTLAKSYVQGVLAIEGRMICMLALDQILPPSAELDA